MTAYSCTEDDNPSQDFDVAKEELDVVYGEDPLQTYDLYLPADRSTTTTDVVLLVHGGGWTGGDKDDLFGIVELLQNVMPDYAIVNLNYRLEIDPENLFVDHLADVESVVEEIANRHQELGISQRMAMAGLSAGGHMALLYAYVNNENNYVKVAGNIIGPTYFLDQSYISGDNPTWQLTLNAITTVTGVPISDEIYYANVSPLLYVDAASVPTIQFLGDEDPLIPVTQGELLKEALDVVGVPNDLIIYEGEGHGWESAENWTDTAERFRDFVNEHL